MKVVLHRLLAFSERRLFAHGSTPRLGWAARPLAGSEPLVVRVQMLRVTNVMHLKLSPFATLFKACAVFLRRFGQQGALVFFNHVRPTLPSSGQPRGIGFAAQGER
jgi:hypothetical protein